jgi:hypothetical protein
VRWGIPQRLPIPTSPSYRFALGPSLSALQGGFAQEFVIPGRRVAVNPESIFQRPEFMDSGFAAFGRAPE